MGVESVTTLSVLSLLVMASGGPPSGSYATQDGRTVNLNMDGPAAITMTNDDDLCVLFWRVKDRGVDETPQPLVGQTCGKGELGDWNWKAVYSETSPPTFVIMPSEGEPFTLVYRHQDP